MTDEEKEAIENIIDTSLKEKTRGVCTISVEYLENIKQYLQTQQEEIEILKQEKATAWEEWNIINEYCEQEKQKYKAEIEKKDRIIEEIIGELENNHCSIRDIVAEEICDDRCIGNNDWTCFKHIKEYFINKVEKENK